MGTYELHPRALDHRRDLTDEEVSNRDLVINAYRRQFSARDFAAAEDLYAPDVREHAPEIRGGNLEGLRAFSRAFHESNPHFIVEVQRVLAQDAYVVIHHKAQQSADAAPVSIIEIFRCEGGRIAEHWQAAQSDASDGVNPLGMF